MSEPKKMGRPTDSPKDYMCRIRMDKETVEKLDAVCDACHMTKADVIRKGIDIQFEGLNKK